MDICVIIRSYCTQPCLSVVSMRALATIRVLIKQVLHVFEHREDIRDNILSLIFSGQGDKFYNDRYMMLDAIRSSLDISCRLLYDSVAIDKMKAIRYCAMMVHYGDAVLWESVQTVMGYTQPVFDSYIYFIQCHKPSHSGWSSSQYLPDYFNSMI